MGFLDKAKDFAGKNPDKVQSGIDKVGDMFDERTGGKHAEHTDKVQDKVGDYLGGGQRGDTAGDTAGDRGENPEPGA